MPDITLSPAIIERAQSILDSPAQRDALTVDAAKVVRAVVEASRSGVNPTGSEFHSTHDIGPDTTCVCGEPGDHVAYHYYDGRICVGLGMVL